MKVIISGGGTGGHLYPALAIGREYKKRGAEVMYIGSEYGIEKTIMVTEEFPYHLLKVKGFSKKPTEMAKRFIAAEKALKEAEKLVAEFQPDLIVGTGGYASYPVLKAGAKLGVKTLLHEANAKMGKANFTLAKGASCVCVNLPDTARELKHHTNVLVTGMPVRDSVLTATRQDGNAYLGIDDDTLLVTVTGGSQGAHHINMAMAEYYKTFASDQKVLFYHIVGKRNEDDAKLLKYPFVKTVSYENKMSAVLARTDLCIGRAGASFLAEIAVLGIPTVLVPYPYSGGHQEKNAAYFHNKGAAVMVLDEKLPVDLAPALDRLIADGKVRNELSRSIKAEGRPEALNTIIEAGLDLITKTLNG